MYQWDTNTLSVDWHCNVYQQHRWKLKVCAQVHLRWHHDHA
jgi:hypothetical protein